MSVMDLNILKEFLESNVVNTIKLQKPSDDNVEVYELVNPVVHVGWIPPKGYLPENMETNIPCLIVGFDDGSNETNNTDINIRISAAVYSPGEHIHDEETVTFNPSFKGYIDLMNLIDRTVAELMRNPIIKDRISVIKPIKWGMYEEQPYPYWYGWIRFGISMAPQMITQSSIQKLL